jgi:D-amino-acid dehydrogenase
MQKDIFGFNLRKDMGFEWEEWEEARLRSLDPELSPQITHAVCLPHHGWITAPGPYVAALAGHFEANGGNFLQREVLDIDGAERGGEVHLEGGERLSAAKIVLAAGVWSGKFAGDLGHKPMLEAERGYHVLLKSPSHKPPVPYMIAAGKFVMTPMESGLRLAGVVEFGGIDAPPSEAPIRFLKDQLSKVYPDLKWEGEDTWMGRRPSTTDSLPHIGPSPKHRDIIFAFGGQHIGLTMGPKVGRLVSDLAEDRPINMDMSAFRVDRFG